MSSVRVDSSGTGVVEILRFERSSPTSSLFSYVLVRRWESRRRRREWSPLTSIVASESTGLERT